MSGDDLSDDFLPGYMMDGGSFADDLFRLYADPRPTAITQSDGDSDSGSSLPPVLRPRCGKDCIVKRLWYEAQEEQHSTPTLSEEDASTAGRKLEDIAKLLYRTLFPMQIRILKILPGKLGTPLECKLLRATLVITEGVRLDELDHPRELITYDALSYSWGHPDFSCSLVCNGIQCSLTKHLKTALLYLRHESDARHLWTDAFCINQHDNAEKGQQVQMMYDIFKKAQKVIAWLGEPADTARPALNVLDLRNHSHDRNAERDVEFHLQRFRAFSDPDPGCRRIISQLKEEIITCVLTNPWFCRTWVRQEVFAARETVLAYGRYSIRWEIFTSALGDDRRIRQHPVQELRRWPPATLAGSSQWLDAVLTNSRGFQASLPQDRIFALQNLVADNKLFPEIDYGADCDVIYQQFVKRLIIETRSLEILGIFENRQGSPRNGLPSWTPDWRISQTRLLVRESWNFNLGNKPSRYIDTGGSDELHMFGWHFGTIATTLSSSLASDNPFRREIQRSFFQKMAVSKARESMGNSRFATSQPHEETDASKTVFTDLGYECFSFEWDNCFNKESTDLVYDGFPGPIFVVASQEVQPGDLIIRARFGLVRLDTYRRKERLRARSEDSNQCYCSYIVRPLDIAQAKYRFLGPCMFLKSLHSPPPYATSRDLWELASAGKYRRWPPSSASALREVLDTWEIEGRQKFILV